MECRTNPCGFSAAIPLVSEIAHWVELQVALIPAREHWIEGNGEGSLELVRRVMTKLPSAPSRSAFMDRQLFSIYLCLGRLQEARTFLEWGSPKFHVARTALAFLTQETDTLRGHLARLNNESPRLDPFQAVLMARVGLQVDFTKVNDSGSFRFAREVVQGEIE